MKTAIDMGQEIVNTDLWNLQSVSTRFRLRVIFICKDHELCHHQMGISNNAFKRDICDVPFE